MAASLDFTTVTVCSGGNHIDVGLTLDVNGTTRTRTVRTTTESLLSPITDEELEAFVKLNLRIIRAQNPANLRTAVLNKVIDLGV